jgi:hypothetical protein
LISAEATENPTPNPEINIQPDLDFSSDQLVPKVNGILADAVFPYSNKLLGTFSKFNFNLFEMESFINLFA